MVEGALSAWLRRNHGDAWWRAAAAGETLRAAGHAGSSGMPSRWLRISGMIHLDWRPVLRQIRAKLIGEMSGYGGPNITTRAGTRKV